MIPASEVRDYVSYDLRSGILTRARTSGWRGQYKIGEVVGSVEFSGYIAVKIDGKTYKAHRLAWAWMTGQWPINEIDHINGNKSDNRWENLRSATRSENQHNAKKRRDSTSGFKGVWRHTGGGWQACVFKDKQRHHVGTFKTAEEAFLARVAKAKELHGEFARAA